MDLMELSIDARGTFVTRPNRFLSIVDVEGEEVLAHVHDPGRLKEILTPGAELLLRRSDRAGRRTRFDVLAGRVAEQWVLINSSLHRRISEKVLWDPEASPLGQALEVLSEVRSGSSRMDHLVRLADGSEVLVEVKGCSLAVGGRALFPDAPTERGTRHLRELTSVLRSGARAALLVLVMRRDAEVFSPNGATDPAFAGAFREAFDAGLEVHPLVLGVEGSMVRLIREIPAVP